MNQSNVGFVDPQVQRVLEQSWPKNPYFSIPAPLIGTPDKYFGAGGVQHDKTFPFPSYCYMLQIMVILMSIKTWKYSVIKPI